MARGFHELTIAEVRPEGDGAVAVRFDLPEALADTFAFTPGQHLTLKRGDIRRSYSIACAPGEGLSVGIRAVPGGGMSEPAQGWQAGEVVEVMAPEGRFTLGEEAEILLIAAGSGITPMISIARTALARGGRVRLVYGNRGIGTIMFRETLDAMKDRYMDRFTLIHVLSREGQDVPLLEGRIDGAKIAQLARAGAIDPAGADGIFLCGPGEMIEAAQGALLDLGVAAGRIRHEFFTPADGSTPRKAPVERPAEGVAVEVILDGARRAFRLEPGDADLIEAAHRAGVELPWSCRGGMCCTCRCKVEEGAVEMAQNWSLEPWEVEAGYVLGCQAQPRGEKLVLDFDAA
ncbi:2Fe-2S iron-sulfur cluster-binding protein [Acidimangrovimonas sediminis]|uniref:2Fe-2S iron-sulfur cluster-binding protein n=1 Tax=Acidimangrovimonas sediminis TaxID=2056283 RepID=UPI000C7FBC00|nr:2Fe-2S iron-sulfur cluster-binding protein [Acidimangrovimonas sediminis]